MEALLEFVNSLPAVVTAPLGGLVGALITHRLHVRSTRDQEARTRRRAIADRVHARLILRTNFLVPAGVDHIPDLEHLVRLTPMLSRSRLRRAVEEYQRTNSDWTNQEGQPMLRDPAGAEAAHRRLIRLLD